MPYFPRVGIELSAAANVRFLVESLTHNRPAHLVRFENGSRSGRFRTPVATTDFVIVFTGIAADLAVITDFFTTYGVATPFTVDHPQLGEGKCYLKNMPHEIEPVVGGDPVWYRVSIPVEGAF